MSLTPEDIQTIVNAFEASDCSELAFRHGDTSLQLSRGGAISFTTPIAAPAPSALADGAAPADDAPAPAASRAEPTPPAAAPVHAPAPAGTSTPEGVAVEAPTIGLFWTSPQPGAPPFVEVGQTVGADDTVAIVEVMKLMSHVKAGVAGTVVAVLVENGAMVEHGDTLVIIAPEV